MAKVILRSFNLESIGAPKAEEWLTSWVDDDWKIVNTHYLPDGTFLVVLQRD